MANLRKDRLIWIDLETTGLDRQDNMMGVHKHKIIEIGMHITDLDFNIIDDGLEIIVHHNKEELLNVMNSFVFDMHSKSGLLQQIEQSPYNLDDAKKIMIDYVASFDIEPGSSPICGNNVGFDKNFIDAQMPEFAKLLHYRKIDVSSFKEVVARQYPDLASQLEKPNKHRGLDDIRESIKEMIFYQSNLFKSNKNSIKRNKKNSP